MHPQFFRVEICKKLDVVPNRARSFFMGIKRCSMVCFLLFCYFANAQKYDTLKPSFHELSVTPYYGAPSILIPTGQDVAFFNLDKKSSYGIFGVNVNYNISKKLSIGLDLFTNGASYSGKTVLYDTVSSTTFNYNVNRLRLQFRLTRHVVTASKFSQFYGFGFGFNTQFNFLRINSASDENTELKDKLKEAFSKGTIKSRNDAFLPFSMRLFYGVKYTFNDYFALQTELGLGGGLFRIGAVFRY
jgi:hypothetical protein